MSAKQLPCVWVVDDDPLQVLVLNRMLTTHPAVGSVKFFSGAKAALEALTANKGKSTDLPELIFLDLIMSRGDGWDFLEQFRKSKNKLAKVAKIIVISSYNEENYNKAKQYAEVIGFLTKPVDKKQFEDLIAEKVTNA